MFVILSVVTWGLSQLVLNRLYVHHTPEAIVFCKLFLTGLLIMIFQFKQMIRDFRWIYILTGVLGHTLYYVLTAYAVLLSNVGFLSVMQGTLPLLAIFFEMTVNGERLRVNKVIAAITSIVGMVLISGEGGLEGNLLLAGILIFISNVAWLFYLQIRKNRKINDSITVLGIECLSSGILLLPFVLMMGGFNPVTGRQGLEIFYVSIIATGFAYYIYMVGQNHIDVVVTSIYMNFMPVVTLVAYLIVYGQTLSTNNVIGSVMIALSTIATYKISMASDARERSIKREVGIGNA